MASYYLPTGYHPRRRRRGNEREEWRRGGGEEKVGKEELQEEHDRKGLKSHGKYNRDVADCASFINSEASWIKERAMRKATC